MHLVPGVESGETPRCATIELVGIEIVTRRKRDHTSFGAIQGDARAGIEKIVRNLPTPIDIRFEIVQVAEAERRPILRALGTRPESEGGGKGGEKGGGAVIHEIVGRPVAEKRLHSHTTQRRSRSFGSINLGGEPRRIGRRTRICPATRHQVMCSHSKSFTHSTSPAAKPTNLAMMVSASMPVCLARKWRSTDPS